ncbi:hypothetical protein F4810DRAFT_680379 [Camillea tinctor]|nr:hypothetical protein F4810DRAFT_680379 [Camillea tinctor]
MRLLQRDNADNYSLTPDLVSNDIPPYAILSHTWGSDEVVFADLTKTQDDRQKKAGYDKIRFCAEQARRHGLRYFWVDTCCIDKSDSTELQTAINSMFRWYRDAKRCYVYLSDVSATSATGAKDSVTPWEAAFQNSRWFTRGWTLQELIAPKIVEFYSREGHWLGDKRSLEPLVRDITGIPVAALRGTPLPDFSVSEREAWTRNRQTKYEEDMTYSLFGIFDVHMPLLYGEGKEKAEKRLRDEVQKAVKGTLADRFSVTFSLSEAPEIQHFVARERELAEMRRTLSSDGSRRVVLLHGLGGIGKTQLAVAYIKRYRDEYSAIFWFNIKDEASIQRSFIKVAKQILNQHADASRLSTLNLQQNHEEVVEAVKAWLSLPNNTRWLLVYDNYDDTEIDIERFLPMAYQGSIIITTRLSQLNLGHPVRIRKLETLHDSLEILSTTSGRDGLQDDIDARSLVKELDGLPLALATAGAYLRRVAISFVDYLRLYKNSWARLHMSTPSLGSYQDRTLCSTWQVSYEQVQEHNPLAAHLLRWWAYFDNEDLWFELVQSYGQIGEEEDPAWLYELTDELKFNGAIGTLHDYGFVEPHILIPDRIGSRGHSIHSCLHTWTFHVLNQDRNGYLSKLAVECVASHVSSQDDIQFWLLRRRLLPHAIKSCAAIQESDEGFGWAFYNLGILYKDQGKLQEAEDMYLRALQAYEKAWGPDHTLTLDTVNNLGLLYAEQGKLQKAEGMYLQALQGHEKAWGPDHTSTFDTVNNLGILYAKQGKLQKAEGMYLRALQKKEKAWGPDHTSTLDTVNNLGLLYADQGKLQKAKEMFLRALQGYEKAIYPLHIMRYQPAINTTRNMGVLLWDQGKLAKAREYYQRAHDNLQDLFGPSHKDVQALRNDLIELNEECDHAGTTTTTTTTTGNGSN